MSPRRPKVIIVGSGLSGCMAALHAAEGGVAVSLLSLEHPCRSSSASFRFGMNAALDTAGEGNRVDDHINDTVEAGAPLADAESVKAMCEAAPRMVNLLERMGVIFDRTPEGFIKVERAAGSSHRRTVSSGMRTAQRILPVLDGQLRGASRTGALTLHIGWEFLSPVIDEGGRCRGWLPSILGVWR